MTVLTPAKMPRMSLAQRWLSIASSSGANPQHTIEQRELARRSDLIAWFSLGLLGVLVIVSPIAIGDGLAALDFLAFLAIQIIISSLNRAGHITLAGIVLVASVSGAIFAYMWSSPLGLTMGQLPNYDALAVGVVIAASVLPRRSGFIVAMINAGAIVADYMIRPHNANVIADARLYPSVMVQTISLVVRPIAVQFIFAVVSFLWVQGTDRAIQRADRAEEIAGLEYRELERTRTLEEGVRYLHQTLAQWAEGNFTRRVPAMPLGILEQVRSDLNVYMERYAPVINATYFLWRLQTDAQHLTDIIDNWVHGHAVIWPARTGSPLDRAVELLAYYGGQPRSDLSTPRPMPGSAMNPSGPYSPPYSQSAPSNSYPTARSTGGPGASPPRDWRWTVPPASPNPGSGGADDPNGSPDGGASGPHPR